MKQTVIKPASWSFSRLGDFQKCRLMYKLKHLDKIPEPERVLRPGQLEFANDRGSRIHDNIETYVRGEHDALAPEADKHFGIFIDLLRVLYADGIVEVEGDWAYNREWEVAPWETGWVRMKLDALIHLSKTEAIVLDWKTGKVYGNEVGHAKQLALYALSTFLRFPFLEKLSVHDVYLDHGEITQQLFTRDQALLWKKSFHNQGVALTDCTNFPANPNIHSCRYCEYGPKHSGHCTVGVRK